MSLSTEPKTKHVRAKHLGIMLLWLGIGLGLRLLQLDSKPIWADEWTTFVFSSGHSFRTLPVNQLLTPEQLLAPATLDGANIGTGIQALMNESTHPPFYFWLLHYWIQLWQQSGSVVFAWVGRSLSVLLGAITLPLTYGIARWVHLPQRTAFLATALMAVSPFGIYLAQDARHYTLTLIWCLLSLSCVLKAWKAVQSGQAIQTKQVQAKQVQPKQAIHPQQPLQQHHPLSKRLLLLWIMSNALGFASHYFYGLFLAAQGLAFAGLALSHRLKFQRLNRTWWGVAIAALGSGVALLPWFFFLKQSAQSDLTSWLEQDLSGWELLDPLGRLFTWFLSMVMLLPIEQVPLWVAIASGIVLLISLGWIAPKLWRSLWQQLKIAASPPASSQCSTSPSIHLQALCSLWVAEMVLFLIVIYGFGRDLSLSPRYVFSLLPVVSLILALLLSHHWPRHRNIAITLLVLGCLGSGTIAYDFAYQKPDRPDLFVQAIHRYYQEAKAQAGEVWPGDPLSPEQPRSLIFATIQKTHSETSKLMGVAQEWQAQTSPNLGLSQPQMLLLKRNRYTKSVTGGLRKSIMPRPPGGKDPVNRPLDLWIINFSAHANLRDLGCSPEKVTKVQSPGYSAHRFICN